MTPSAAAHKLPATPRRLDPEDAQHALAEVQERLRRQQLVADLVHRQEEGDAKANLVEDLVHRQHEAELKTLLDGLHPADIAFILESLPKDERQTIWKLVSPEHDADVLLEVEDWVRESLIEAMDRQDLVAATGNMDADELADLAPDLPPDVVAEVQKGLTEEERAQLLEAMGYPEDSVGAIMDFEMVRVREDVTLEVVLRYLRRLHELPDHTDQIFVVDRQDKLQGILPLSRLLVSEPETEVRAVMNSDFLTLNPLDSDADAAGAFERYDLVSAPVMDDQGRLIGRVTIADVVDVMREDSQEQALSRAGLQEEDIFAPVSTALRNRAPWLLFNLYRRHGFVRGVAVRGHGQPDRDPGLPDVHRRRHRRQLGQPDHDPDHPGAGDGPDHRTQPLAAGQARAVRHADGRTVRQSGGGAVRLGDFAFLRHRLRDDGRNDLQHAGRRLGRRAGAHGARAFRQGSRHGLVSAADLRHRLAGLLYFPGAGHAFPAVAPAQQTWLKTAALHTY